ncbi:hypothetical protein BJ973_005058 [Actinoplanes tereljensis]|uniref:hypothetical protein n=1 Tax=Paractinoplanes tereljensis TaxID=571912 RepID=UPI0019414C2E|nr:hypothetical protein [Actinoplanes tereljensis]
MITSLYWVLTAAMLAACVVAVRARLFALAVVAAALVWDNLVIAAGSAFGAGDLLLGLSVPRYVAHALLTPLLIPIVFKILGWPRKVWVWTLTGALIAIGAYFEIIRLRLEPETYAGTLRYVNAAAAGPPVPAIVTILVLIVAGAIAWRRGGPPWLCLAAAAMFAGAATLVPWLGNLGELALLSGILLTARRIRSS